MTRRKMREEYCVNCHLCEIHCLVAHSASGEIIHAYEEETPCPLPRIFVENRARLRRVVRPCRGLRLFPAVGRRAPDRQAG